MVIIDIFLLNCFMCIFKINLLYINLLSFSYIKIFVFILNRLIFFYMFVRQEGKDLYL